MNWVNVISSDLSSVAYENGTLYIAFRSGGAYSYFNVPESVYKGLLSSFSKGRYFHSFIKNTYSCTRFR